MTYKIREINKKNITEFARIQQNAYAGAFIGTPEELDKLIKVYTELLEADDCFFYGIYLKSVMIGAYITYDFTLNFHGNMIKASGIGSVAVDLLHKKEGVAKFLLKQWISTSYENGCLMNTLYPFNAKFYKNFGFGFGSPLHVYHIPPSHFKSEGDKKLLSWGDIQALDGVNLCYSHYQQTTNGMKARTFSDRNRLARQKHIKLLEVKEENTITGYIMFEQKGLDSLNFLKQKLVVTEMCALTPAANLAISTFLHNQKDQIDYIELHTFNPYFYHMLHDLSFASQPQVMPLISHKVGNQGLGIMWNALEANELLRLIDDKTTYGLDFFIKDDFINEIEAVSIHANVEERMTLSMSRSTFSSWIIGALPLKEAYAMGQLKTSHPEDLKQLDRDFNFESPICFTRF